MFKKAIFVLTLSVSSFSMIAMPVYAAEPAKTATDPAQLKLAGELVLKLLPPGTYEKMMMDMASGDFMQQIMGMDMATLAGIAGATEEDIAGASGKSLMDLAAEKDPNFKERMDITMKVMFTEIGKMMGKVEPEVRMAMSDIYARKYSGAQLTDMNAFFATPSGSAFAADFMSTFTDKEMIDASMKMVPVMLEGLPEIMQKVEAATAHLPPLPSAEGAEAGMAEAGMAEAVTSDDMPWMDRENWSAADLKKVEGLEKQSEGLYARAFEADEKATKARMAVMAKVEKDYVAKGWKAPMPEFSVYDDEGRAILSQAWSQEDNAAIAALEVASKEAEEKATIYSRAYGKSEAMLSASYRQAMINAGQDKDGVKRPIAEAVEEAGREYDRGYEEEASASASATAGDAVKAAADAMKEEAKR